MTATTYFLTVQQPQEGGDRSYFVVSGVQLEIKQDMERERERERGREREGEREKENCPKEIAWEKAAATQNGTVRALKKKDSKA